MKLFVKGDKSKAICETCGLVSTTFDYRDVPFRYGAGVASNILVAVCDVCQKVVAIPAQSTPAIRGAKPRAICSIEAQLPAVYLDALDLACFKIDSDVSLAFRKQLLGFYIHQFATGGMPVNRLKKAHAGAVKLFSRQSNGLQKRLSLKVSQAMEVEFKEISVRTALNKTELLKSLVYEIKADVLCSTKSIHLDHLRMLAAVSGAS